MNFGSSALNKLIVGTLNRTGNNQIGQITVGPCGGEGPGANACPQSDNENTVLAQTTDAAGGVAHLGFYLSVIP